MMKAKKVSSLYHLFEETLSGAIAASSGELDSSLTQVRAHEREEVVKGLEKSELRLV